MLHTFDDVLVHQLCVVGGNHVHQVLLSGVQLLALLRHQEVGGGLGSEALTDVL